MQNLLRAALSVIPKQRVRWERFKENTVTDEGREVPTYYGAQYISASVQPVDIKDYEQFGLDASKKYFTIWASQDLKGTGRDRSPDRFTYDGLELEMVGHDNWYLHNGWGAALCIQI